MSPQRIQRKRTKGWRMPENTVYVGRGSKWGNPYKVGEAQVRMPALDGSDWEHEGRSDWEHEGRLHKISGEKNFFCTGTDERGMPVGIWHQVEDATVEQCLDMYRDYMTGDNGRTGYRWPDRTDEIRAALAGKDLACWCPLDQPCHADVLLEIANELAA